MIPNGKEANEVSPTIVLILWLEVLLRPWSTEEYPDKAGLRRQRLNLRILGYLEFVTSARKNFRILLKAFPEY